MAPGIVELVRQPNPPTPNVTAIEALKQPSIQFTEIAPTLSPTDTFPQSIGTLLRHPSLITQDFDQLRFEAAAFAQLLNHTNTSEETPKKAETEAKAKAEAEAPHSNELISSPYNHPGHYLALASLPAPSQLFAQALTALRPTVPHYATAEYSRALNFPDVLAVLRQLLQRGASSSAPSWPETSFYVVVFRSKLKAGVDNEWLYKLDYESHREACESGGLLKYWFGKADGERRNLATCFWHSRADAFQGGLGPWHKKARAAGRELYESIVFSTHRFTVLEGAVGYRLEDWKE